MSKRSNARRLLENAMWVLCYAAISACGRHNAPAAESENAPGTTHSQPGTQQASQTHDAAAGVDSHNEQLLDELESRFATDLALTSSDKQAEESKISGVFASFKNVTILDPVQCKQRLCRLSIRAPDVDQFNDALVRVVGVPSPDNPTGKALLPYSLTNPNHKVESDGSVSATLFIRKVSWEELRK